MKQARTVDAATDAVVALHSSDPTSVVLSARARVRRFAAVDLEDALYERRSLVRMIGMRRTLFVVPRDTAVVMDVACARALANAERTRIVGMLESQGIVKPGAGARWLRRVEAETLEALGRLGEATARQLTSDVPDLGKKLVFGEGSRWEASVGVSTRVLFLLAGEGRVVRARPVGTWVSGQYRWAVTERWLGEPLVAMEHADACDELARRYLRAFGPVTSTDVRWWTGWTARLANATLERIGAVAIELEDGTTGLVDAGDTRSIRDPGGWVALLPGLDPTTMGWKDREWFLGEHAGTIFDRNGNAGPSVWADGRIVGGWAQAPDGAIAIELLERVDAATRRRIDAERDRLRDWLGDVRFRTRFPSPLERKLLGAAR